MYTNEKCKWYLSTGGIRYYGVFFEPQSTAVVVEFILNTRISKSYIKININRLPMMKCLTLIIFLIPLRYEFCDLYITICNNTKTSSYTYLVRLSLYGF
jgi:hypothetical protein